MKEWSLNGLNLECFCSKFLYLVLAMFCPEIVMDIYPFFIIRKKCCTSNKVFSIKNNTYAGPLKFAHTLSMVISYLLPLLFKFVLYIFISSLLIISQKIWPLLSQEKTTTTVTPFFYYVRNIWKIFAHPNSSAQCIETPKTTATTRHICTSITICILNRTTTWVLYCTHEIRIFPLNLKSDNI